MDFVLESVSSLSQNLSTGSPSGFSGKFWTKLFDLNKALTPGFYLYTPNLSIDRILKTSQNTIKHNPYNTVTESNQ